MNIASRAGFDTPAVVWRTLFQCISLIFLDVKESLERQQPYQLFVPC